MRNVIAFFAGRKISARRLARTGVAVFGALGLVATTAPGASAAATSYITGSWGYSSAYWNSYPGYLSGTVVDDNPYDGACLTIQRKNNVGDWLSTNFEIRESVNDPWRIGKPAVCAPEGLHWRVWDNTAAVYGLRVHVSGTNGVDLYHCTTSGYCWSLPAN